MDWLKDLLEFKIIDISGHSLSIFQLLLLIVILIVTRVLVKMVDLFINRRIAPKYDIDEGKKFAILKLINYLIYLVAFVLGLESLGFDISILLAGSAALLVGIGFGLQEVFKDLISGLILLFEGSLKVGDVIEVDNLVGLVKEINIRTSKIRTRDGIIIIVPNSNFINEKVINWSNGNKLTRFHVNVGVAYGSDVDKVSQLLLQAAANNENISGRPKAFVRFADFGSSSLDFKLFFWTEQVWRIENTLSELRFDIDKLFREHGVTIPFPQRDLHIKTDNTGRGGV